RSRGILSRLARTVLSEVAWLPHGWAHQLHGDPEFRRSSDFRAHGLAAARCILRHLLVMVGIGGGLSPLGVSAGGGERVLVDGPGERMRDRRVNGSWVASRSST